MNVPDGGQAMLNVPISRREVELRLPALPHRGAVRPTDGDLDALCTHHKWRVVVFPAALH